MFTKLIERLARLRQTILNAFARLSGKISPAFLPESGGAPQAARARQNAALSPPENKADQGPRKRQDEALWHQNFGLVVPFYAEARPDGLLRFEVLDGAGFCSFRMMLDHPARFRAQTIPLPGRPEFLSGEGIAELALEDLAFAAANRSSVSEAGATAWPDPEPIWEDCRKRLSQSGLAPGLLAARRDAFASQAMSIISQAAQKRITKP